MKEIKFRGYSLNVQSWVSGDLIQHKGKYYFTNFSEFAKIENELILIEVVEESVGQYTGLQNKNGKEIYEGDIVEMNGDVFYIKNKGGDIYMWRDYIEKCCQAFLGGNFREVKIIGNIYKNPELLK